MVFFKVAPAITLLLLFVKDNSGHGINWYPHFHNEVNSYTHETKCKENCRQSPIDITKKLNPVETKPLIFSDDYCKLPKRIDMHSDGHSIVLKFLGVEPTLSSGPLPDNYVLHSIHFHWGQNDKSGSEHLINGCAFPMELHAVHTKNGMEMAEAQKDPEGIAVIGYFFEVKPYDYSRAMPTIVKSLRAITAENNKTTVPNKFRLSDLMMPFHDGYVSYNGSLTTPPYSEAVIWIISPYTIKVTPHEMEALRSLSELGVVEEEENFRPPQPLNGRTVNYNYLPLHPFSITGCSGISNYYFESMFTSLILSYK